jgi:hypothetical protein
VVALASISFPLETARFLPLQLQILNAILLAASRLLCGPRQGRGFPHVGEQGD